MNSTSQLPSKESQSPNTTARINFLEFPYEIRLQIYTHIFHSSTVSVQHKSRAEYEAGDGNLHKLSLPPTYDIVLSCQQCHSEARALFCSTADVIYDSTFSTRRITTICSRSMAAHLRRILDVEFMYFEDFREMNAVFPRLEVLGINCQATVTVSPLQEREFRSVSYEYFERHFAESRNQVELMEWMGREAGFRTFISTAVSVTYFGDNSRDFEKVMPVILDVKNRRVVRGAEGCGQRRGLLYELLENGKIGRLT